MFCLIIENLLLSLTYYIHLFTFEFELLNLQLDLSQFEHFTSAILLFLIFFLWGAQLHGLLGTSYCSSTVNFVLPKSPRTLEVFIRVYAVIIVLLLLLLHRFHLFLYLLELKFEFLCGCCFLIDYFC